MNEKKETPTDRKSELEVFSMITFDSATSHFLALLIIKSYRKNWKREIQKKGFHISQWKKLQNHLDFGVLSCIPSERLKKFRWPAMIVKLRKG